MKLVFKEIRDVVFVLFASDTLLTAVTGDIASAVAELVYSQEAVVCTALAPRHRCLESKSDDIVDTEHGSGLTCVGTSCYKSSAESTHDTRDIGTDGIDAEYVLKCAQNSIVVEGSTLNYDVASKFLGIRHLDNLEKSILDYRICKT